MVETGFVTPPWLAFAAMALSFITVILILSRQSFKVVALNLLVLISLLILAKQLFSGLSTLNAYQTSFYLSLFETAEFVLLVMIFRVSLRKTKVKEWINYLLIAFLATYITLLGTQPNHEYLASLLIAEALVLVLLCLMTLLDVMHNQFILPLHSIFFWIAGGTLFYSGMFLAVEVLSYQGWLPKIGVEGKKILLAAFGAVRLLFYLIASLIKKPEKTDENGNHFRNSFREPLPK